jgi:hypothetical protein
MALRVQQKINNMNPTMGSNRSLAMSTATKPKEKPVEKEKTNTQLIKEAADLPTEELYDWFEEWVADLENCDSEDE